jgi:carboxyl-terminal processing protease
VLPTSRRTTTRTALAVLVFGIAFIATPSQAAPLSARAVPETVADLRKLAQDYEKRGEWLEACWWYDELVRRERSTEARDSYKRCLRRLHLATRHRDRNYREALAKLTPSQALDVYVQVLSVVQPRFVDRNKSDLTTLFRNGAAELGFALEDEAFLRDYLSGVSRDAIKSFRYRLLDWPERRFSSAKDVREYLLALLSEAKLAGFPEDRAIFDVAVVFEFANGACNALDEYTLFLSPSHYAEASSVSRGKYAGIGIDLQYGEDGSVLISRVVPGSPASEAKIVERDRIFQVDGLDVASLTLPYVTEKLRGLPGSEVELVWSPAGMMDKITTKLIRRPVPSSTVSFGTVGESPETEDIGYVRIFNFTESTPQEMREALARLQTTGIRALIVDLRGNPGGLFNQAVQVSELFLPEGTTIVGTSGTVREFNQPFRGGTSNPFALPMVVLVDGDTASAAEVLAGGLKEHGRARLMGQTTFGKGTIQVLIPLDGKPLQKMPGGIRLTVAKFYFSGKSPDGGRGITPHDLVNTDTATLINTARQHLRDVMGMMMPPMNMPTTMPIRQ